MGHPIQLRFTTCHRRWAVLQADHTNIALQLTGFSISQIHQSAFRSFDRGLATRHEAQSGELLSSERKLRESSRRSAANGRYCPEMSHGRRCMWKGQCDRIWPMPMSVATKPLANAKPSKEVPASFADSTLELHTVKNSLDSSTFTTCAHFPKSETNMRSILRGICARCAPIATPSSTMGVACGHPMKCVFSLSTSVETD